MRIILVFLMGVVGGVLGMVGYQHLKDKFFASETVTPALNLPEFLYGAPSAPIRIIEYSSLGCGNCTVFKKEEWPKIREKFVDSGRVQWSMRHFPFGNADLKAGMLAFCAEKSEEVFKAYVDQQGRWIMASDPIQEIQKIALETGMTQEKIDQCLKDEDLLNRFIALRLDAQSRYNLQGTPAFIIGGEIITGYTPFEVFETIIPNLEEHLNQGGDLKDWKMPSDAPEEHALDEGPQKAEPNAKAA